MKKILLLTVILAGSLFSATFNVSSTPELRTALETAATNSEDDTIILADGTYKTTDDRKGTFIYLSNESNTLTLQGSSANNVILSGDNTHQILNHQSTEKAPMKLKNLSFIDGNNIEGNGGAIYANSNIEIFACIFTNNSAKKGGGVYSYYSNTTIINSSFTNNSAKSRGGGACFNSTAIIANSNFINNSADFEGGGIYSGSTTTIINSSFTNNDANAGGGACFSSYYSNTIINSIFKSNSNGVYVRNGKRNTIYNSIFINNVSYDINGRDNAVISKLYNNYIDEENLKINSFNKDNIFKEVSLDFVDSTNNNFHLKESSDLIDAGTMDIEEITLPNSDLDGNTRVVGGSIDIGPYEFTTSKPTINSITFTGEAKELSQLVFTTNYTLADERTLSKIEYDYLNNGTWTILDTYTYNKKGTYTLGVKVTDNKGEFSTTTKTITIDKLPFSQMTEEQKLVKAIDPKYYDEIVEIINNKSNINSLTANKVDNMDSGWILSGTTSEIRDMSIFNNASIIWIYTNDSWSAYSSNATMKQKIEDANIPFLHSIPANSGIWIKK